MLRCSIVRGNAPRGSVRNAPPVVRKPPWPYRYRRRFVDRSAGPSAEPASFRMASINRALRGRGLANSCRASSMSTPICVGRRCLAPYAGARSRITGWRLFGEVRIYFIRYWDDRELSTLSSPTTSHGHVPRWAVQRGLGLLRQCGLVAQFSGRPTIVTRS